MMNRLKGMTWNHERGIAPLVKASALFKESCGTEIIWDARSLSDFELLPLEKLSKQYDLIMIDHPHIGIAHEEELLLPLEEYLPETFLKVQKEGSVGLSYASYHWKGHQYAVPLDAAAQVSAYREEFLHGRIPASWNEVLELAAALPDGKKMGIPFVPVHAFSSFFSLCSQLAGHSVWCDGENLDEEIGGRALELLGDIVRNSHIASADMDPIQMLESMMWGDEIVYCPLVYGYSNYARKGYGSHIIKFADMPGKEGEPRGSMIGGVGLAVSARCVHIDTAIEFLMMVADPEFQTHEFFMAGGQPGHMAAWEAISVNKASNNFFRNTLQTLKMGSMRPRFAGYIDFQAEAGKRIRSFILDGSGNQKTFIRELNELMKECRENRGIRKK